LKILITGGAGFIGSHTADALIAKGHQVRILDSLQKTVHPKGKPGYIHKDAEFIHGDARDKKALKNALKDVDAVYHFAAYQDYLPDFSTYFHVNSGSTALLYELIVEQKLELKIRKVVVAASQAVMGEGRYHCPDCSPDKKEFQYPEIRLEEQLSTGQWEHLCRKCDRALQWLPSDESVINPCNQYAISKYSQEQIAIQFGKRYNIPSVAMRYSIVQGPRQSFYNAYSGAMRIFALSLYFGHQPTIFEDGKQIRDYVNIQDVVNANLMVLENPEADNRVFNVGGGKAWTVADFYRTMQEVVGRSISPILSGFYRYGDTRHIFSDTGSLEVVGWKPAHGIKESIESYWDYLNRQDEIDDILEYAGKHMKNLQVIRKVKHSG
jgi:dTDP-L-rhamnose 4-epimerase